MTAVEMMREWLEDIEKDLRVVQYNEDGLSEYGRGRQDIVRQALLQLDHYETREKNIKSTVSMSECTNCNKRGWVQGEVCGEVCPICEGKEK